MSPAKRPPPGRGSAPGSAGAALEAATGRHLAGDAAGAEAAYRALLRAHPGLTAARSNLAVLLADAGRVEEAITVLREAEAREPGHPDVLNNLGVLLRRRGAHGEARGLLERACEAAPERVDPHYNLATTLIDLGRAAEAVGPLERAVKLAPERVDVRANLCRVLAETGRLDEALAHGREALVLKDRAALARPDRPPPLAAPRVPPFDPGRPERNVIAFSLWGREERYVLGAVINSRIAPHLYPGWTCRFYCAEDVPEEALGALREAGAQVRRMPADGRAGGDPTWGLHWRFLAADDREVDRFLCRDCDARLNVQERVAVDEWIRSGRAFHVMRDSPFHTELILAGLWGGVAGALPSMAGAWGAFYRPGRHRWIDQDFLRLRVWPAIRDHCLIHDRHYRLWGAVPFPEIGRRPEPLHVGIGEPVPARERSWALPRASGDSAAGGAGALAGDGRRFAVAECRRGPVVHLRHDTHVGRSLATYGEWAEPELALLGSLLREGDTAIDAGANVGVHAVFMAERVGDRGTVVALEPQRLLHQALCANAALNDRANLRCLHAAAGARRETVRVPVLDPDREQNFGALEVRGHDAGEPVPCLPLDDLGLGACAAVKIDVEGMELDVLAGARRLIERHRPALLVECNQTGHSRPLIEALIALGYRLWWQVAPLHRPDNFRGECRNLFPGVVDVNLLCLHPGSERGAEPPAGVRLEPVAGPDDDWREVARRVLGGG